MGKTFPHIGTCKTDPKNEIRKKKSAVMQIKEICIKLYIFKHFL